MKRKFLMGLVGCLLLLCGIAVPATACCEGDPPGDCYRCEDGVWVRYGNCWEGCPDCESCHNCYCQCTSECCEDLDCGPPACWNCVDCECEWDCTTGQCCDDGECVLPDTTWVTTSSWSVEVPSYIKDKVNAAINSIPGVSGVSVTESTFTTTARQRECCDPPTLKHQKCSDGTLTLDADLGDVEVYGGSFEREIDFGSWGASVAVTAHVYIHGDISASATAGQYINECDSDCIYGTGTITATLGVTGEVSACCCIKLWGTDYCSPEVGASADATVSFTGTARINQCGNCDGTHGDITLNDIILSGSVDVGIWEGSFTYQIYP